MPDQLFRWIEDREHERLQYFDSSWGRVLDAGTGRHSLSWLLRGDVACLIKEVVAVTGEQRLADELSVEFAPSDTPHAALVNLKTGNWQNPEFLAKEKKFDVIIADYLIGAIEGFAPYYQDQICTRLEQMLIPGGRIYLVGLQPLSESQVSMGSNDADIEASKLIQEVARIRDACLLLADHRCYREYPIDWSHRQLEKSRLKVTNSLRLANVYGRSSITRQLQVGKRHVPMFKDAELAVCMEQALDRLNVRLEEFFGAKEQRSICFGFDYVIAALKSV